MLFEIFIAVICSLVVGAVYSLCTQVLPIALSLKLAFGATGVLYLIHLFIKDSRSVGKIALGGFIALMFLAGISVLALSQFLIAVIICIWFVRSLQVHQSITAAFGDFLLCLLSSGAALWALAVTGSPVIGVWTFFLLQATHVFIPRAIGERHKSESSHYESPRHSKDLGDRFQSAWKTAEYALGQIIRRGGLRAR